MAGVLILALLVWGLGSLFADGGDPAGDGAAAPGAHGAAAGAPVYAVRLAVYPLAAKDRAQQVQGWLVREGWPEVQLLKVTRQGGERLELYVGAAGSADDRELVTLLGRLRELTIPGHPADAEPPFASAFIVRRPTILTGD